MEIMDTGSSGRSESAVKSEILLALGMIPWIMVWNNPTGVARGMTRGQPIRFGLPGAADILGVAGPGGRAIAIEVKRPGGRQRPAQKKFQTAFEARGGIYVLAHSAQEAKTILSERLNRNLMACR